MGLHMQSLAAPQRVGAVRRRGNMMRARVLLAGLAMIAACSTARAEEGTLVIVGGGLDWANADILTALLEARPSDAPGIAIIPAATQGIAGSTRAITAALERHGARPEDVAVVRLALTDDPATPEVDESTWRGNADDQAEIAKVARAGAIWFVGGDQQNITAVLREADGRDTPMAAAIRRRLAEGAVVGGTSAGAMIMGTDMIIEGQSLGPPLVAGGGDPLVLGPGLGFLEGVLIHVHFGERGNLGLLAAAVTDPAQPLHFGLGIDEDTALVVRPRSGTARVVGSGYVFHATRCAITGLSLGLVAAGDSIDLATWQVTPAPARRAVTARGPEETPLLPGGGMAYGDQRLAAVVGEALLEGGVPAVERHSFAGSEGVTYRFTVTPASTGWWSRDGRGRGRYTIAGVDFAILPIAVQITPAE
jgi:cyanophycinase